MTSEDIEKLCRACEPLAKRIIQRKRYSRNIERIKEIAVQISRQFYTMGNDNRKALELGAMLMDIGEIIVKGKIFNKSSTLSVDEKTEIRKHSQESYNILNEVIPSENGLSSLIKKAVLHHHERMDGEGPCGIQIKDISMEGKILAFATAYVVMGIKTEWREPLSNNEIVEEIKRNMMGQFCPQIAWMYFYPLSTPD